MRDTHMRDLFASDPQRAQRLCLDVGELCADYSKHRITAETLDLLVALADSVHLERNIEDLFAGAKLNVTEGRPALHTALRAGPQAQLRLDGRELMAEIRAVLSQMRGFAEELRAGRRMGAGGSPIRDVVAIGIGGSYLGPLLATDALRKREAPPIKLHFVSNIDAQDLLEGISGLSPASTLFLIASKSFTTLETTTNAKSARRWLERHLGSRSELGKHFAAVTANRRGAEAFGIAPECIFDFWSWVGGRYSVWSAVGLPIAIACGFETFEQMLAGARTMDEHFKNRPLHRNLPVLLGLLGIWYGNFFGADTQAIVPYDERLKRLPEYLQQLEMESNGKRVDGAGRTLRYHSCPIIWGGVGTNGQHAFFQALHQGTRLVPVDFVVPLSAASELDEHHELLFANCLAQSRALMWGRTETEARALLEREAENDTSLEALLPHRIFPGNVPSTTIAYPDLTASALGSLIALYEHKVFVQATLWGINPFDQWGVELGKQIATGIAADLRTGRASQAYDSSTSALMARFGKRKLC